MNRVIVFGTGVVAYGAITECAQAGFHVIHLTTKRDDIAARSRLIDERAFNEFDAASESEVLSYFLTSADRWKGAMLLPVNDRHVVFVSRHFDALSDHYRCCTQPWAMLKEIVNKNRLYLHAHDIGVPAPKILEVTEPSDLSALEQWSDYPCIVKPFQTPDFYEQFGQKVHVVYNREEAISKLEITLSLGLDVMLSEIIPGPEDSLFTYATCLDGKGQVLAEIFSRKVRQNSDYGVASVIRTVEPVAEIRDMCLRLLRHFSYRGLGVVEVKKDERDDTFKLIEINARPVLYQRLFGKAGLNISEILESDLSAKPIETALHARPGIYWMHNLSEIYALKRHVASRDLGLRDFFRPYLKPHIWALPILNDWRPFAALLKKNFGSRT